MKLTTKKNSMGRYEINEGMLKLFLKLPFMRKFLDYMTELDPSKDITFMHKSKKLDTPIEGSQEFSSDGKGYTARQLLLGKDTEDLESEIKKRGLEDEYKKALKALRDSRRGNRSDYF